jgi:hypothetical protein
MLLSCPAAAREADPAGMRSGEPSATKAHERLALDARYVFFLAKFTAHFIGFRMLFQGCAEAGVVLTCLANKRRIYSGAPHEFVPFSSPKVRRGA